ncbi:MAG: 4-(cytidine 5'-diphospho)-2-C-methyl-D-erythritol kinase [Hyphomonadaceae bacterium]|nr:4-(cytidine 5'-diphospho)-2-C-methyl-D-erythritol kinase [Hyphomonadaceae bacterium]MBC6411807.1 4-(cytidine 5'-diphospho)-2-C-methyl-D-erythritol kinase [Hyphomonadaceae bacterium]
MPSETARAKINLTLHVGALISDPSHRSFGYHPVDSLVMFADTGDKISCEEADAVSLDISGAFADNLQPAPDNLILRAYEIVREHADLPLLHFHLEKNLPVAAGIGGGSANAAAVLRLLKHYADLDQATWLSIATGLGADVPVCLLSKTAIMRGIGETVTPLRGMGTVFAVLVNPGIAVSTGEIFAAFDSDPHPAMPEDNPPHPNLSTMFRAGQNDLQPYTLMRYPGVAFCHETLCREIPGNLQISHPQHIRMSGSGATCFILFDDERTSGEAARQLKNREPDWWVKTTRLGEPHAC